MSENYNPYQLRQAGFSNTGTLGGSLAGPSGIGGAADKSQGLYFRPTLIYARHLLDTAYIESWAYAAFVDYMVDDMFIRWREFEAEDEAAMIAMQEQEKRYKVAQRLAQAMKWGRLFGTALLVIVTSEGMPHAPLDVDRLQPGSLRNLFVVDRFSAEIVERDEDIMSEQYGQPVLYKLTLPFGSQPYLDVHASRILRFDGIELPAPMTAEASLYDKDWGQSSLIRVATAVEQLLLQAQGTTHLTQEASIAYVKSPGVRDATAGTLSAGVKEQSISALMEEINRVKSMYRMIALDEDEELKRLAVNFGGLADLLDRASQYVAASGGYPATRFLGTSPLGMNATGEGDMKNYVVMIEALRLKMLPEHVDKLDMIMAANAGLAEPPEYRWLSLFDMSDEEQANIEKLRVDTVVAASQKHVSVEEGRQALMETTEMFAFINPSEVPEPDPMALPQLPGPKPPPVLEDARRMRPSSGNGSPTQRRFINRQIAGLYRLTRQMSADLQEAFEQLAADVEEAMRPHLAGIVAMLPPLEDALTADSVETELGPDVVREVSRIIAGMDLHQWNADYLQPIAEDFVLRSAVSTFQGLDLDFNLAVNIPDPEMREFIRNGGTRMGLIDLEADTKQAVFHGLNESRVEGLGMTDTAAVIREHVPAGRFINAGPEYRSQLIARTEVRTAQVEAAGMAYEASEVVDRVRIYDAQLGPARSDPHCIARNGKVVTLAQARQERGDEHPNGTYMEAPEIEPLERT